MSSSPAKNDQSSSRPDTPPLPPSIPPPPSNTPPPLPLIPAPEITPRIARPYSGGSSDVPVPGPSTPSKSKVTVKVELEGSPPLREMTDAEVAAFHKWKTSPETIPRKPRELSNRKPSSGRAWGSRRTEDYIKSKYPNVYEASTPCTRCKADEYRCWVTKPGRKCKTCASQSCSFAPKLGSKAAVSSMPGPSTKRKLAEDVSPESSQRKKGKGKEVEREEKSDLEADSDDEDLERYTRIRHLVEQYNTLEGNHKKFARFRLEEECREGGLDVDTVLGM